MEPLLHTQQHSHINKFDWLQVGRKFCPHSVFSLTTWTASLFLATISNFSFDAFCTITIFLTSPSIYNPNLSFSTASKFPSPFPFNNTPKDASLLPN